MDIKRYSHKFVKIVTSSQVVEMVDKTEEMPKVAPVIHVTPFGKSGGTGVPATATLTPEQAKELSEALTEVLK